MKLESREFKTRFSIPLYGNKFDYILGIFIFCSVFAIQRKFSKKDTKEIKEALGLVDANLSTEDAKDTYTARRLLMRTSAVLDGQVAE